MTLNEIAKEVKAINELITRKRQLLELAGVRVLSIGTISDKDLMILVNPEKDSDLAKEIKNNATNTFVSEKFSHYEYSDGNILIKHLEEVQ